MWANAFEASRRPKLDSLAPTASQKPCEPALTNFLRGWLSGRLVWLPRPGKTDGPNRRNSLKVKVLGKHNGQLQSQISSMTTCDSCSGMEN